jgi:hypothetical protein
VHRFKMLALGQLMLLLCLMWLGHSSVLRARGDAEEMQVHMLGNGDPILGGPSLVQARAESPSTSESKTVGIVATKEETQAYAQEVRALAAGLTDTALQEVLADRVVLRSALTFPQTATLQVSGMHITLTNKNDADVFIAGWLSRYAGAVHVCVCIYMWCGVCVCSFNPYSPFHRVFLSPIPPSRSNEDYVVESNGTYAVQPGGKINIPVWFSPSAVGPTTGVIFLVTSWGLAAVDVDR